jgi:oxaloacetate decarboxylase (Na+ extruding) subunit alpha
VHVLSATRFGLVVDELRALVEGAFGTPPRPIDPAVQRAVKLLADDAPQRDAAPELEELRDEAEGLAASEEELLLLALFGQESEPLLRTIRNRTGSDDSLVGGNIDQTRAERIRELVRIVQESGVGELSVEEAGMRVSVRRTEDRPAELASAPLVAPGEPEPAPVAPPADGVVRIEAPMVGTFYRAPQPGAPPFVQEGDTVAPGQTLCILEAMKLMNEVKADLEATVRSINVENGDPVEFGQLLFELEPLLGRPLDAV